MDLPSYLGPVWWIYPVAISMGVGFTAAIVCMFPSKQEQKELEESNE